MNTLLRTVGGLMAVVVVSTGLVGGTFPAQAQSPDIVAFSGSGELTWTNSLTNLFYEVQWAPALNGPGSWHSGYGSLSDVQSSNATVTIPVPMYYRISGSSNRTHFAAPVPKTGQTNSYQDGDDGGLKLGVAWPDPRFSILANTNVVRDNLTGLIWARTANLVGTSTNWATAIDYCNNLNYGGVTNWRLPNRAELMSLFDQGAALALSPGHPFIGVQTDFYWTSTTYASDTALAWIVWLGSEAAGTVSRSSKALSYPVWPVSGGQ